MIKCFYAAMVIVLLSSGLAVAQGTSGTNPSTGSSTTSQTNPNVMPAPSAQAPVGNAPGVNPSNSQDVSNRANSQDMSRPNAANPQLMSPSPTATPIH
jgi:hypothetical protein